MQRNRRTRLARVRRSIQDQGTRRVPSVNAVEPEVRTDSSMPPTEPDPKVRNGLNAYVAEWGYDVPEAKWADFHKWLAQNERKLAQSAPKGVMYRGTFAAIFGPRHRPDGRYRTFWALNSLQDVQNFWTKGTPTFRNLVKQLLRFRDRESTSGFSQLFRLAAGAPVY